MIKTKKITILFLISLLPFLSYAQPHIKNTSTTLTLKSVNSVETTFQLCYEDSLDLLVVTQSRFNTEVKNSKIIKDAASGEFFLKRKKLIIFNAEEVEFQLKEFKQEKFLNTSNPEISTYYFYYVITKSKLRTILKNNVDLITLINEDEIQFFEPKHSESVNLYIMVYEYFKYRNWK